jgi:hypothetical protein
MKFKKGEIVKAFVKLGVQSKPRWAKMTYQKCFGIGHHAVHFENGNQTCVVAPQEIRKYKPIEDHDAAIVKLQEGFTSLVVMIKNAASQLLPDKWNQIKVDADEKIVYLSGEYLSIGAGVVEVVRKTIGGEIAEEIASWMVTSYHQTYSNTEPPSVDEVEEGHNPEIARAVALAISKVYELNANAFWEGIREEQWAIRDQEFAESEIVL